MARLFIGRKTTGGGGALKIMRNNTDDPNMTPSTDYDKFLFDSEVNDLGYAVKSYTVSGTDPVGYYPPGTDGTNCHYRVYTEGGDIYVIFFPDRIAGQPGVPCLMEIYGPQSVFDNTPLNALMYAWKGITGDTVQFFPLTGSIVAKNFPNLFLYNIATSASALPNYPPPTSGWITIRSGGRSSTITAVVWSLPCDDRDFSPPAATPIPGQRNVLISPSSVKIARPGFDVTTATGRELIADSDRIPLKIIKAGSIANLPARGSVDVSLPFAVPAGAVFDAYFTDAGNSAFTIPNINPSNLSGWGDNDHYVTYTLLDGNKTIRFSNNASYAMTGRFQIYATNDGQTSGSGPVLHRGNDGTQDFVQLVRPGASASPNFDDIIADTRLAYVPLIATGYATFEDFTAVAPGQPGWNVYGLQKYTVNFTLPAGTVAFPKVAWGRRSGSSVPFYVASEYDYCWGANGGGGGPANGNGVRGSRCGDNRICVIYDDHIDFWQARGGPAGFNPLKRGNTAYDLRYHIFAVPDSF